MFSALGRSGDFGELIWDFSCYFGMIFWWGMAENGEITEEGVEVEIEGDVWMEQMGGIFVPGNDQNMGIYPLGKPYFIGY